MIRFAIFASGSGTNAESIIRYFKGHDQIQPVLLVSNKKDAYVLERAKDLNIPSIHIPSSDFKHHPGKVIRELRAYQVDFIVLAGFLLLIPAEILQLYPYRIINIHPALLPAFGGKGMYGERVHRAVIESGKTQSGISIHYVNEKYDEGAIIFQAACPVKQNETAETLAVKIHELEYAHYPAVIEQTIKESFSLE